MALAKANVNIPLALGVNTKTDPWQLHPGEFTRLSNIVYTTTSRLTKRNGFPILTTLPTGSAATYLSTHQGSLVALGTELYSYNGNTWNGKGALSPVELSVVPASRTASSQTSCDSAMSTSGLSCVVWMEGTSGYYQIINANTGEIAISATLLPNSGCSPRVWQLGNYFIVVFLSSVGGSPRLQYIAVPVSNPGAPTSATNISTQVSSATTAAFDGSLAAGYLFLAWNGSDVGGAIRTTYLDRVLTQYPTIANAGLTGNLISYYVDYSFFIPLYWITYYASSGTTLSVACYTAQGTQVVAPTVITSAHTINQLTTISNNGVLTIFYQVQNSYGYSGGPRSDYIQSLTCNTSGTLSSPVTVARGAGIASKAFLYNTNIYLLSAYGSPTGNNYQPSYFLLSASGAIIARLAYANGGGYVSGQVLPSVALQGSVASFSYIYADIVQAQNKGQGSTAPAIYSQTATNIAQVTLSAPQGNTVEIAGSLFLGGGMLRLYDGNAPVELNFHVWPEDIAIATATTGGSLTAQKYYYYATYEWTDAQGNIHRSAPSVPVAVTTTGTTSANTVNVPTLRLTAKSNVRIVLYRWSAGQQIPYQITSITSPLANNPAVDYVSFVDTQADSSISGNNILYTFGGSVEDICPPACAALTLFNSRVFLLDAEDRNLLWYSKQVIESTPVEMSDLFTYYVAPTAGSLGSTGPVTALAAMDDKLIMFKGNGVYYMVGAGPDNTGANDGFSDPVFITSTVGCTNQASIAFIPQGIIFQSDKGIWLLGRDLSTQYIGASVEQYNSDTVMSAVTVPGTTHVRFTMASGTKLVYDYYFNKWATFDGIAAVSSTLYNGYETQLNKYLQVYQETPGVYVDGTGTPVTMSFTTGWLNLAGLQGYQRVYWGYILGNYYSPHFLTLSVAYDYNPSATDIFTCQPENFSAPYGGDGAWGQTGPWGGPSTVEQYRIFFRQQKCQAMQITLQEQFDGSKGAAAGQGLSLSGFSLVVGAKSSYPRLQASKQVG